MYPTLFSIGSFRIDTYSVIWFIALSMAIIWSIKRLELYGLDEYESRKIMAVSFFFMLLGARSFEYINNWKIYLDNPSFLLDLNRGGLHEFGAISGAFLSAMTMCLFTRKVSFLKLCDVSAPPAILAIAVGRWGCFMNGCCVGIHSKSIFAVHFPFDRANVFRHPVQIYYSVIASVILLILIYTEKKIMPLQKKSKNYYSVIAPMSIISYSLMRLAVMPFRNWQSFSWIINNSWTYRGITFILPLSCLWLVYSLRRLKSVKLY